MAIGADDLPTRIVAADGRTIAEGAKLLRDGRLVAFPPKLSMASAPTRSTNMPWAPFSRPRKPRFNPLIVHVRDRKEADEFVIQSVGLGLGRSVLAGGLTLVLPRRALSAGASGQRRLSHGGRSCAGASDSAAPSGGGRRTDRRAQCHIAGRISATNAADAADEVQGRVDLILDGGPCRLGIESTVIGFDQNHPILLRLGAVARDDIERILGPVAL